MSVGYAVEELTRYAGTQFDPQAVSAIIRLVEKQDQSLIHAEAVGDGAAV
jgi:HD-GYP domain-containing protein (c-di-GMP phosphodiesterase class II)